MPVNRGPSTGGLWFSFDEFNKRLQDLARSVIPDVARNAMGIAGMALLNDAVMEIPTVPMLLGFLRGSGSVFVDGNLVATSPQGAAGGSPATVGGVVIGGRIVAVVAFNTPYAAFQHEGVRRDGTHRVRNYTTAGSGAKFLESKIIAHGHEYFELAASKIREALA